MLANARLRIPGRGALLAAALIAALLVALIPAAVQAAPAAAAPAAMNAGGTVYKVRSGDTLSEIARYFGVTVQALKDANHLSSSTIYIGQRLYIPAPISGYETGCSRFYRVQRGDTLTSIARAYGINTYALASANGISDADHIVVGQRICIPNVYTHATGDMGGGVYVVQRGDTLSEIARMYQVSMRELMRLNHIEDPNHIYVGQRLRIP